MVFPKHRKKIYGAGLYHALGWYYDNPIWISTELRWGLIGVEGMIIGAIIINTGLLLYHRNKKANWILWDALYVKKEKEEIYGERLEVWKEHKTIKNFFYLITTYIAAYIFSFLQYCLRIRVIGKPIVFLFLSFQEDPFIATTFIRHERQELNGITVKDTFVFMASLILSIGYWAARNGLLTEFVIRPILKL